MKPCCDNYVQNSQPKKPQNVDFFYEIQTCPCGQKLRIHFRRIEVLGGEVHYAPISAEAL